MNRKHKKKNFVKISKKKVYPDGIRHIRADKRVNEWKAPGKKTITKCAVNQRQVVVALSGRELVYFEMDPVSLNRMISFPVQVNQNDENCHLNYLEDDTSVSCSTDSSLNKIIPSIAKIIFSPNSFHYFIDWSIERVH